MMTISSPRRLLVGALVLLNLAILGSRQVSAQTKDPGEGGCGICWNDAGWASACCQVGCPDHSCCLGTSDCTH